LWQGYEYIEMRQFSQLPRTVGSVNYKLDGISECIAQATENN
jgi:hypothetical protein